MFDAKRIKEEFATLVGFRQNENPDFLPLSPSLVYNGDNTLIQHPLVTIENMDMLAKNFGKYVFPTYSALTTYDIGAKVTFNSINYESLVAANLGNQPDTNPAAWQVLNLLDTFLQDVFSNAAEDTVNDVVTRKRIDTQTKTLMASKRFFEGVGNMTDMIINQDDLVGVQIKLLYRNNILAVIEQIGIQLSAAQNPVKFYIYHSSNFEPIATIQKDHTKMMSFQWHEAKLKLQYISADLDAGGVFFIMYDQSELTGQAIRKQHNFHLPPCGWCNNSDIATFNLYSKYIVMNSCRVKAADRNGINLWDITKTQYTPDTNWGLNFTMTIRCDITDFLIQNKDVFRYAMRDTVTKKLLEMMANTTRQNVAQGKVDVLARNELMASYAGGMGFMKQWEDQMKAVNFEVSALDDVCMPCNNKTGLRFGTASLSMGM